MECFLYKVPLIDTQSIKMLISKVWIGGLSAVTLQTPHYSRIFVGAKSLYFGLV